MKKTLAIMLSLALVICMIPGAAFAASTTPQKAIVSFNNGSNAFTVYNGSVQTPDVAVSVNGNAVSTFDAVWSGTVQNAGKYTVSVSGKYNEEDFAGSAEYEVKAIDLTRATILVSGDLTDADLTADKTALKSYGMVTVIQDGVDITNYCELTSKVDGNSVRITAATKGADGRNIIAGNKFADYNVKSTIAGNYEISSIMEQTYTGKAIEPYVTVKAKTGYGVLTQGIDYEVTYANNTNAGSTASVIVTGIGKYTGTISGQFVIAQKSINDYDVNVKVADAAYNNGNLVIPTVVVTHGDKILTRGVDYNLSTSSKNIGIGTVKITGIGNYKDQVAKSFNIVDASKEIRQNNTWVYIGNTTSYAYNANYNGEAHTPTVTVYVGETRETATLLSSAYYDVTYNNNVKPGTAIITVTGRNGYAGSVTSSFTIKETEMTSYNTTITGYSASYVYDNTYQRPAVTVTVNGRTLKENKEYTVSYLNNKNMSTAYSKAKIIVTAVEGAGYKGSVTAEFSIVGKSIAGCDAYFTNGVSTSTYTGSVVNPAITVREGNYTFLRQGTDYTVNYKDANGKAVSAMREAGKYTIVIKGTGNYSGELTLNYEIIGKDISSYVVTLKEASVKADGSAKKPTIVSVKSGATVLNSKDYTVMYLDASGKEVTSMKTPGTYKVVVTGKNGYAGNAYASFRIVGTPQEIKVDKTSYKVYVDSPSFKITATATGDGTGFAFGSSNPDVATVDQYGNVTVHKLGRAKITVTTTGMKTSDEVSEEIFVKVYPDKAQLSRKPWTEGKKGSLRVRWEKQDDVTYYEVRYSRDKSFAKNTYLTKKVNASTLAFDTQSTSLKNLKSGSKYYVKVRAVKVVYNDYGQELKYYGKWSNWKSCVTK